MGLRRIGTPSTPSSCDFGPIQSSILWIWATGRSGCYKEEGGRTRSVNRPILEVGGYYKRRPSAKGEKVRFFRGRVRQASRWRRENGFGSNSNWIGLYTLLLLLL